MSFRRSDDNGISGSRWRVEHRSLLERCGIPSPIAASDRRWVHALLHGYDPETGWQATWLSPQQAGMLLPALEADPDADALDLIRELRKLV
ncbi:MAG: hypothetical protein K2W96_28735 [Gemmataceae bacterium]|nr:hypothetical protein [Gemmataceae bacterium]